MPGIGVAVAGRVGEATGAGVTPWIASAVGGGMGVAVAACTGAVLLVRDGLGLPGRAVGVGEVWVGLETSAGVPAAGCVGPT